MTDTPADIVERVARYMAAEDWLKDPANDDWWSACESEFQESYRASARRVVDIAQGKPPAGLAAIHAQVLAEPVEDRAAKRSVLAKAADEVENLLAEHECAETSAADFHRALAQTIRRWRVKAAAPDGRVVDLDT